MKTSSSVSGQSCRIEAIRRWTLAVTGSLVRFRPFSRNVLPQHSPYWPAPRGGSAFPGKASRDHQNQARVGHDQGVRGEGDDRADVLRKVLDSAPVGVDVGDDVKMLVEALNEKKLEDIYINQ